MVEFLVAPPNIPFLVAYVFMAAFALVTVLSGAFDHGHGHDADADADLNHHAGDLDHDGDVDFADHILGFLGLGRVPLTMLLVAFAWSFGSVGYVIQWVSRLNGGQLFPSWMAGLIALVPAVLLHALLARGIGHFTARDDSTAVHSDSFVGKTATIVLAETQRGKPTQAKLRDQHGQTHYILVEPHREEDAFRSGEEVILVAKVGSLYEAMPNDIDLISNHLRPAESQQEKA